MDKVSDEEEVDDDDEEVDTGKKRKARPYHLSHVEIL